MTARSQNLYVVHVIGGLQLGGAETLLYRLATMPSNDIRHEVICLADRDWYSGALEAHGIVVHHLGMVSPGSFIRGIPRFAKLISRLRPDVIQSWMYLANMLSGAVGRALGIPVVWGIHGSTFEHLGWPSRLAAYLGGRGCRWLAKHVVNCSVRSSKFHGRMGYHAAPCSLIHNGYDSTAFTPDASARQSCRESLGIDPETFVIGTVSRWHLEKDIPTLLAALALVAKRKLRPTVLLIGPGLDPASVELTETIRQLAPIEDIRLLGKRGDIPDLARAIDLHILPSRAESFPNVVAETMLAGTPNAVTDVGDAAAMVGHTGWVVRARSPDLLAEVIERAYREWRDQPQRWQLRRSDARERIASNYAATGMQLAYEDVWRAVTGRSGHS